MPVFCIPAWLINFRKSSAFRCRHQFEWKSAWYGRKADTSAAICRRWSLLQKSIIRCIRWFHRTKKRAGIEYIPAVFCNLFLFLWKIVSYNLTVFHTKCRIFFIRHIVKIRLHDTRNAVVCDENIRFFIGFFPNFIQQIIDSLRQPRLRPRRDAGHLGNIFRGVCRNELFLKNPFPPGQLPTT